MLNGCTMKSGDGLAFPDVCKTPTPGGPVPMPYPNQIKLSMGKGSTCCKRVKVKGKKLMTTKTEISMSSGDEPGTAGGGVVSSKFKGPAKFKKGSSRVKAEGSPVTHMGSIIGQNGVSNANHPAGVILGGLQSDFKVMP